MFGTEEDVDLLFVKIASISLKNTVTISLSQKFEESQQTTKSFTYTAVSGEDMVGIVTTPYVRYYHQIWDPQTQAWSDLNVDIPSVPRTTEISADQYDNVAAQHNAGASDPSKQWSILHGSGNLLNAPPATPPPTNPCPPASRKRRPAPRSIQGRTGLST